MPAQEPIMTEPATVHVALGARAYDIYCHASFAALPETLAPLVRARQCAVITNTTLQPLYAAPVQQALAAADATTHVLTIPDGEQHKTMATAERLLDQMIGAELDRGSVVVALGGGVVGDIAGFVAAVYMRGIDFVQIPTTLLAMVDSSVGGKTGVNLALGKNMVGAFHQPRRVYINWGALQTLPAREFRAGYAEVIKYGMIADAALFALLEEETPVLLQSVTAAPPQVPPVIARIIARCCAIKADVVVADEREGGLRAILNYGHTFGHAIEQLTGYGTYAHGEAVAMGMHAAALLGRELGMCPAELVARQRALLLAAGLPVKFPALALNAVLAAFRHDKKTRAGTLRFVLPRAIGTVEVIENPPAPALRAALLAAQAAI
jgi:3-dehydroquinate synthase